MPTADAPFALLNEAAIAAAELRHDPYDYTYIESAIPQVHKDPVLADAPQIPYRGSYGLPDLKYGPQFGLAIQDLLSDRFRGLVENKFDIDLSKRPPCIVMMGNTTGNYNEGYAHPDSRLLTELSNRYLFYLHHGTVGDGERSGLSQAGCGDPSGIAPGGCADGAGGQDPGGGGGSSWREPPLCR